MSNFNRIVFPLILVCVIALTALITRSITLSEIQAAGGSSHQSARVNRQIKDQQQPKARVKKTPQTTAPFPKVLIEDEEFQRAGELEQPYDRRSSESDPANRPSTNRPDEQRKSDDSYQILEDLSDEEKNELWWRIAAVARRSGQLTYRYSLTTERALPFAIEYNVRVLDIFQFFKSGVKSEWRKRQHESFDAPKNLPELNR